MDFQESLREGAVLWHVKSGTTECWRESGRCRQARVSIFEPRWLSLAWTSPALALDIPRLVRATPARAKTLGVKD